MAGVEIVFSLGAVPYDMLWMRWQPKIPGASAFGKERDECFEWFCQFC